MANVFTGKITGEGFINLATATGLTFTAGNVYTIQPLLSNCYIREGSTGVGFLIEARDICFFTKEEGVDVYIDPVAIDGVQLNIAETVSEENQGDTDSDSDTDTDTDSDTNSDTDTDTDSDESNDAEGNV